MAKSTFPVIPFRLLQAADIVPVFWWHSLHSLWLLMNLTTRPGQVTLSESSCTTSRLQHRIRPISATASSRSVCSILRSSVQSQCLSVTLLALNVRPIHPTYRKQSLCTAFTYTLTVRVDQPILLIYRKQNDRDIGVRYPTNRLALESTMRSIQLAQKSS